MQETSPYEPPTSDATQDDLKRRRAWKRLGGASVLALFATSALLYLLFSDVPHHALQLAKAGGSIPLSTRVALAVSNWLVRLLPVFLTVGVPTAAGVGVLLLVVAPRMSSRGIQLASIGVLLFALAESFLGAYLFFAMRAAY